MNDPGVLEHRGGRRLLQGSLAATALGVVALIVGGALDARRCLFAYLTAWQYVVTIAVGALLFLMICHAMHAGWPTLIRRLTEAMVATLPLHALLFVPVLVALPELYPWVRPDRIADEHARHLIALKAPWLTPGFFVVRAVVFFAVWIAVGFWLRRWSRAEDAGAGARTTQKMSTLSGALLPLVGLSLAFASFDWFMSLTPTWASTMVPVYYFAGGFVAALAGLTVLTWAVDRTGLIAGINDSHYYALGRLLLAFVIFWAYAAFFQLLLIWIADKPEEVTFYLARVHGGWAPVSVVLVLAQFVLPFLALLSYDLKRRRDLLALVAAWLLAAHYVDVHWLVMPSAVPAGGAGSPYRWIDFGALLAIAGATVSYGVWRLHGAPLIPVNAPALAKALQYESL